MTFRDTVFEDALPFFGVTVTLTLHVPVFRPFSLVPDTLQYFAEAATTFSDTFEVDNTLSFANAAIDFALVGFLTENTRGFEPALLTPLMGPAEAGTCPALGTTVIRMDRDEIEPDDFTYQRPDFVGQIRIKAVPEPFVDPVDEGVHELPNFSTPVVLASAADAVIPSEFSSTSVIDLFG